jgi:SAM-dependent methyltransferase
MRIAEVPIPTYYGEEISHVNGLAYAKDVSAHVVRYRLHKSGFASGRTAFASDAYEVKSGDSSHGRMLAWLRGRRPSRVLDLGCSDGSFAEQLRQFGHSVIGVDRAEHPSVRSRVEQFVTADLERGIPDEVGGDFDVVLAADVLEHVRYPELVLQQAAERLAPGATVIACVPNFGHWYPRTRVAVGRFDYDRRGILDRDHVRFFTRRSLEHLIADCGYGVRRREAIGVPLEVLDRGTGRATTSESRAARFLERVEQACVSVRPTLFAYQFLYEIEPSRS